MTKFLSNQVKSSEDKIRKICNGNLQAESFCYSYIAFLDMLDDLYDGDADKPMAKVVATTVLSFITNLSFNNFWEQNKNSLYPLIVQGSSAWVDSESLTMSGDAELKASADVLKSYYGEVLYHVAFLTGGPEHLFSCSKEYRGFNFDAST